MPRHDDLSESDIEAISRTSEVIAALRRLSKALQAIPAWRLTVKKGVPSDKFGLIVAYEDALGELKEAIMRATHKRLMRASRKR